LTQISQFDSILIILDIMYNTWQIFSRKTIPML